MSTTSIPLGTTEQVKVLFAYPNLPSSDEPLADTVRHWVGATLVRDGCKAEMASVRTEGDQVVLDLDGPTDAECQAYAQRFPEIMRVGWEAWEGPVQEIKARQVWSTDGNDRPMWDPNGTNQWRFFLTLGVGIVNHRSLQFFHYPPARLLDPLRDSMNSAASSGVRRFL